MSRRAQMKRSLILPIAVIIASAGMCFHAHAQEAKQPSCIAVLAPAIEGVPGNATDAANGVRDLITSYLQGPSMKAIGLDARIEPLAAEEAKQKGCGSLLIATVRRKSSSHSLLKAFGQAANTSSYSLPYGGGSAASTVARAGTTAGLQAASSIAQSTKAKDELSLEYRLQSPDGKVQFGPEREKRTAKTDGEDLLTPAVLRAAEAIVTRAPGK